MRCTDFLRRGVRSTPNTALSAVGDQTTSAIIHADVRNIPMWCGVFSSDNQIITYFGTGQDLDAVGEAPFKKQLYQCMLAQALAVKSDIEVRRSTNTFGILTWQLNEIWPTGTISRYLASVTAYPFYRISLPSLLPSLRPSFFALLLRLQKKNITPQ